MVEFTLHMIDTSSPTVLVDGNSPFLLFCFFYHFLPCSLASSQFAAESQASAIAKRYRGPTSMKYIMAHTRRCQPPK